MPSSHGDTFFIYSVRFDVKNIQTSVNDKRYSMDCIIFFTNEAGLSHVLMS